MMGTSDDEKRSGSDAEKASLSSTREVEAQKDVSLTEDRPVEVTLTCVVGSWGDFNERGVDSASKKPEVNIITPKSIQQNATGHRSRNIS